MKKYSAGQKIKGFKRAAIFSAKLILLVTILNSTLHSPISRFEELNFVNLTAESLDECLSDECIPSTSLTDLLFKTYLPGNFHFESYIDKPAKEIFTNSAIFINAYLRNHFYNFLSTKAP